MKKQILIVIAISTLAACGESHSNGDSTSGDSSMDTPESYYLETAGGEVPDPPEWIKFDVGIDPKPWDPGARGCLDDEDCYEGETCDKSEDDDVPGICLPPTFYPDGLPGWLEECAMDGPKDEAECTSSECVWTSYYSVCAPTCDDAMLELGPEIGEDHIHCDAGLAYIKCEQEDDCWRGTCTAVGDMKLCVHPL